MATNHISSIDSFGNVNYDQKCLKRQPTRNEHSDVETATSFVTGLPTGVELLSVDGFPVIGLKNDKFVFMLGVKL